MIEQRVTLRYGAQQIPAIVQAVQGDTGRDVIFELADYEIPAGATANYYIDKPDDTAIYNSSEVISSTEILAHLTEQALAVPGRNNGQVRILNDGEVITSFDFVLEVEAFRGILRLQSETEVNIFDQAINEALSTATAEAVAEIQAQTPVVTGMQNSIASTYSSSSTYNVGDYVVYNARLYRCTQTIAEAEAWTSGHWAEASVGDLIKNANITIHNNERLLELEENVTITPSFEQGTISSNDSEPVSSIRIRSDYIYIGQYKEVVVTPSSGYQFETELYTADKTFSGYIGFTPNSRTIESGTGAYQGCYIRFLLRKGDGSNILPQEGAPNISVIGRSKIYIKVENIFDLFSFDYTDINNIDCWQRGTRQSSGIVVYNTTRIASQFIKVKKGGCVFSMYDIATGAGKYRFEINLFDERLNRKITQGWEAYPYILPDGGYLSINLRKVDNSVISDEDFADMVQNIFFTESAANNKKWEFDEGVTLKSINHRGWNPEAPENTLPAYIESFKHGFRFVETDIRFTRDNIPVCLHDATLNRTCRNADGSEIRETVYITDITYEESQEYDAGIATGEKYAGTKIPSLDEFLRLCKRLDLLPYLDIGGTPEPNRQQIEAIVEHVEKYGLINRVTYLARIDWAIWITQKEPSSRICTTTTLNPSFVNYMKACMTGYNQVFMNCQYLEATDERVDYCRELGMPVEVWTVNSGSIIEAMNPYISGVTSDYINALEYLKGISAPSEYNLPTILYNRADSLSGGYKKEGNRCTIKCIFKSLHSATDTPQMLGGFPAVNGPLPVNVSEYNADNEITATVSAILVNETLYINKVENGRYYAVYAEYDI